MTGKKLKIAILCNDLVIPTWSYEMLSRIEQEGFGEIVLIIRKQSESNTSGLRKSWMYRRHLFYYIYRWADRRLFRKRVNAFRPQNISTLLPAVPIIDVSPLEKQFSDVFPDDAIESIREYAPDVILRLGFRILRGEILNVPRYGIWSYHHGDNLLNRGGPPCFWECFLDSSRVGSVLQILSEDLDNGKIIYRSWSGTVWFSPTLSNESNYWKSASFVPRMIKELNLSGWENFLKKSERFSRPLHLYSERLFKLPGNWQMAMLILGKVPKILRMGFIRMLKINQWFLAYNVNPVHAGSLRHYKHIIPPADRYWADPFIIRHQDRNYVFIEEFLRKLGHARISVMEIDATGKYTTPVPVLERPYHLSYPFVFEHEDKMYMIPETRRNKTIELYVSNDFPGGWELVKVLMKDVEALDATLIFDNGRWWMFTTMIEFRHASSNDELFLFSSDDLFSDDWQPHPLNPVISNAQAARPAGRIFRHEGKIYRPSQDCTKLYGYGFSFSRIDVLTETDYSETVVESVYPNWHPNIKGTHTFGREGDLTVIDALRMKPRF